MKYKELKEITDDKYVTCTDDKNVTLIITNYNISDIWISSPLTPFVVKLDQRKNYK